MTEDKKFSLTLLVKTISSAITVLMTHPLRVCVNNASVTTSPLATIKESSKTMWNNALLNVTRGTLSTLIQVLMNHSLKQLCGESDVGKFTANSLTGIGGLAVSPIEVYFMRNNFLSGVQSSSSYAYKKFIYNKHMFKLFGVRDIVFSLGVFGTANCTLLQQVACMLPCTIISAAGHKLAYTEATKDLRNITNNVPNYDQGYKKTFADIAFGRIKHPAFQVYFQQPKNFVQAAINFSSATCGLNMFFWRLLYLTFFARILSYNSQQSEKWIYQNRFFKNAVSHSVERDDDNKSFKNRRK